MMMSPCSPLYSLENLDSDYCLDAISIASESDASGSQHSVVDMGATSPAASCSTHLNNLEAELPPRSYTPDKDARTGSSSCLTAHGRFQKALLELMSDKCMSLVEGPGGVGARSSRGPCRTTSKCRGVTKHRRTEKWEAHFWHHGKQLYLGGFQSESCAAKAHDIIALKCRGRTAETNYVLENYAGVIDLLPHISKDELIRLVRRQSCSSAVATAKGRPASKKAATAKRAEPATSAPVPATPSRRSSRIQVRSSAVVDTPGNQPLTSGMADSARSEHSRLAGGVSSDPQAGNLDSVQQVGLTKVVPARQRSLHVVLPDPTAEASLSDPTLGSTFITGSSPRYSSAPSPVNNAHTPNPSRHAASSSPGHLLTPHSAVNPLHLSLSQQPYSPSPYPSLSNSTMLSQSPVASTSTHMAWPSPSPHSTSLSPSHSALLSSHVNLSSQVNLSTQVNLASQVNMCRSNGPSFPMPSHNMPAVALNHFDMFAGQNIQLPNRLANPTNTYAAQQLFMQAGHQNLSGLLAFQHQNMLANCFQQQGGLASLAGSSPTPAHHLLMGMDEPMFDNVLQEHFHLPSMGHVGALAAAGGMNHNSHGAVSTGMSASAGMSNANCYWPHQRGLEYSDVDLAGMRAKLEEQQAMLARVKPEAAVPGVPSAPAVPDASKQEDTDILPRLPDCPNSPLLVYTELEETLQW